MPIIPEAINELRRRAAEDIVGIISETLPLKKQGKEYVAQCPFHSEKSASFSVNPEKAIFKCFGCGEGGDAFNFIEKTRGMRFMDAARFLGARYGVRIETEPERSRPLAAPEGYEFDCEYIYTDFLGHPLHKKIRYKLVRQAPGRRPKDFRQAYMKDGDWVFAKPNNQRFVLYNLPDVEKTRAAKGVVFLCEGEKDADNVRGLGLCSTTMTEGANKTWLSDYTDQLCGAKCVAICQDNDEPGIKHVNKVASILTGAGIPVKVLTFGMHKDVSDWIAAGGTKAELWDMVSNMQHWSAPAPMQPPPLPTTTPPLDIYFEDKGVVDSDMANAKRFAFYYGDTFHFAKERGWLAWNGTHWEADQKGFAVECAKEVVRRIPDEISVAPHHVRPKLEKHSAKSQSNGALNSMLKTASTVDPITVKFEEFDSAETLMKLNVKNGTIDLTTGKLYPHERKDKFTRVIDINYEPDATCPEFMDQLLLCFRGDEELTSYIQRFAGYMLTGSTDEQCFQYWWGDGANGKSALVSVFEYMLGPYGVTTPANTFMQQMNKGIPNDIARMVGARFVWASEANERQRLDESLIKQVTGGDKMAARFLHKEFFEFRPQFKLIMTGNKKPKIDGDDYGLFRRVHLVPFTFTIPENSREPMNKVLGRLFAEKEGILSWMVRGCLEWQANRLEAPSSVRQETENWFKSRDFTRMYIDRCCETPPAGMAKNVYFEKSSRMYASYKEFSQASGFYVANLNRFTEALKKQGFGLEEINGELCFIGIRLKLKGIIC